MKDLSREERLEQRIAEMSKESHKKKWQRIKLTFCILSPLVYFIALRGNIIHGTAGILGWLIFAPLIAIGVMIISYMVLGYIIDGVKKDMFNIGEMVGKLDEVKFSKHE